MLSDEPPRARPRRRVRYTSTAVRGGFLEPLPDPEPNDYAERRYAIRLDIGAGPRPLDERSWLLLDLTDDERAQWVRVLSGGVP